MENIIECSICMEKYNTTTKLPRILSCGHTFCTSCLISFIQKSESNCQNEFSTFISCPVDKQIGHSNQNVNEIPINRLILDVLDFESENQKKLSKQKQNKPIEKEESPQKAFTYINNAKDKLNLLIKTYTVCEDKLKNDVEHLVQAKIKCIDGITAFYDDVISKLNEKKIYLLNIVTKYSGDKIAFYTDIISHLNKLARTGKNALKKVDMILSAKKKLSLPEEVEFVSGLGMDYIENGKFLSHLNYALIETDTLALPDLLFDISDSNISHINSNNYYNIGDYISNILNYVKVLIPNSNSNNNNEINKNKTSKHVHTFLQNIFRDNVSSFVVDSNNNINKNNNLNNSSNELNIINISNSFNDLNIQGDNNNNNEIITKFLWFQHNSQNIFSYNTINNIHQKWNKEQNTKQFIIPEMSRVTQINNDSAIITGGVKNNKVLNLAIIYSKGDFIPKSNMLIERRNHSSIKINNYIFVCGGIDKKGNVLNHCEAFSLNKNKWREIAPMLLAKSHHTLAFIQNTRYFFSFGGENKYDSILETIERYMIMNNKWEILTLKLPIGIECCAVVPKNEREVLIFGGFCSKFGALNSVLSINFEDETMETRKSLDKEGWSIYKPIIDWNNNNAYIFFDGEDITQPTIVKYNFSQKE